jgi:hypothetical protein
VDDTEFELTKEVLFQLLFALVQQGKGVIVYERGHSVDKVCEYAHLFGYDGQTLLCVLKAHMHFPHHLLNSSIHVLQIL